MSVFSLYFAIIEVAELIAPHWFRPLAFFFARTQNDKKLKNSVFDHTFRGELAPDPLKTRQHRNFGHITKLGIFWQSRAKSSRENAKGF